MQVHHTQVDHLLRPELSQPRNAAAPVDIGVVRPLLRGLDREQRRAVTHGDGPLLVVAGPGTGKTEVISRRVAWLIATRRARPAEILALTFTEKAADEMQARVDLLVPYGQAEAAIHTFHALGDRLLREFGYQLGLDPSPRVIGQAEAIVLLREHVFELGLDRYRPLADPTRFLGALVDLFGRAKDEAVRPEDLAAFAAELAAGARSVLDAASDDGERRIAEALLDEAAGHAELANAYGRYQRLLQERALLDFGDQVSLAVRLLDERPAVRAELERRYRYVLVDEAQDANPNQMRLVRSLAGHGNVTVVGDDDQAIYAFRGAAVASILGLSGDYPGLRHIVLRRNHRSRAPILAAARRLIRHNDPHRLETRVGLDKQLVPARRGRGGAAVREVAFASVDEEAAAVATEVAARIRAGASPSSFAVLVRTNADAEPILLALERVAVPARSGAATGLAGAREVRDLLALLRVVVDPGSSTDLYAVATGRPYQLGGPDLTAILEAARRRHRSLWSVLCELVDQPGLLRLTAATHRGVARLVADLQLAMTDSHERPAADVLYGYLRRSGAYAGLIAAAERGDDAPLRRVARLFEVVRAHSQLLPDPRLPILVPHLSALLDVGEDPGAADDDPLDDRVAVLTVHKAKGLEFPVVYLVGLAEGRFPRRGRPDRLPLPAALRLRPEIEEAPFAEERRLCYVAMTRARDELVLSHAAAGANGGRRRRPSPFIAEALDRPASVPVASGAPLEAAGAAPADRPAPPAAIAGSATDPVGSLSLSYSQLDDYLTCPLRYRLRHVARVPTPPHHALVLGNALHQAVAAFHLGQLRGRPLDEAAVLDVFARHWSGEGFLSRHHEDARYQAGRAALQRFVASAATPTDRTTVAVERGFSVRLGRDVVRGRYDRVDASPAGPVIVDYKSSDVRDPKRAQERARDSLQLQLYALAHEAETGELPAAVELRFLESGLTGSVTPDGPRLEKAKQTLMEAADGIRAGRFAARPDVIACGYCPYRDICPSARA